MRCQVMIGLLCATVSIAAKADQAQIPATPQQPHRIIMFVWDGLRPDSITQGLTPNLYQLRESGVNFTDNHASYPTFTMMNGQAFATGDYSGKTGYYGNVLWVPKAKGVNAMGKAVDFQQPVFTEDYKILQEISAVYDPLLEVEDLFTAVQKAGYKTAAVGKAGPAFIQDYLQQSVNGIVFGERHVFPLAFAEHLQSEGYPLPKTAPLAFPSGQLTLSPDNGDPTAFGPVATLKTISGKALGTNADYIYTENVTPDPTATSASPYSKSNRYLMMTYLQKILPEKQPLLSVVWLRNPDTTEHNYGVGSASFKTALRSQDNLLGMLLNTLKQENQLADTDIIVVSDHGHSNVSGPLKDFPLRAIQNGTVTVPDPHGYSVSGDVRVADLMSRAGFKDVYDGFGCSYDPVLFGIKADGQLVYPVKVDADGKVCHGGAALHDTYGDRTQSTGTLYTTPSYVVPSVLPNDAVVIAPNGGSMYFYVPSHNAQIIARIVRFLQSREEFGAVFVDNQYGNLPGTLPLSLVHLENMQKRNPDIIVGMTFDAKAIVEGVNGIEFSDGSLTRGDHGSFSPIDVHNTMIAMGPDFKKNYKDTLPTGNVDVAPTIAYLLGVQLPNTDGRPLLEALNKGLSASTYTVLSVDYHPATLATGLTMKLPTNPDGTDIDQGKSTYSINLLTKLLMIDGDTYTYFDQAEAIRK